MSGLVCLQVLSKILSTKSSFNPKKPLYSSSLPTLRLPLTFSLKYLLGNVLARFCLFLFHIIVIRPSRRLSRSPRLFLPSDLLPIVSLLGLFFFSCFPVNPTCGKRERFRRKGERETHSKSPCQSCPERRQSAMMMLLSLPKSWRRPKKLLRGQEWKANNEDASQNVIDLPHWPRQGDAERITRYGV